MTVGCHSCLICLYSQSWTWQTTPKSQTRESNISPPWPGHVRTLLPDTLQPNKGFIVITDTDRRILYLGWRSCPLATLRWQMQDSPLCVACRSCRSCVWTEQQSPAGEWLSSSPVCRTSRWLTGAWALSIFVMGCWVAAFMFLCF